jgi:4-amino-4-deoxychorismate lyase
MILVNGQPQESVSVLDRGFSYGDGLFETIRMLAGHAPLWSRHMQRLALGCERLRLPLPDAQQLREEALQVSVGLPDAVLRITLTRGSGERGYALPAVSNMTRVVAAFPMSAIPATVHRDGIRMHLCTTTLAEQPLLAGVKHLNRLEQVLARAEWNDPAVAEGLVCDQHGRVISATAANLFAVIDDTLVTPSVDRCGVAGVARAAILHAQPACEIRDISLAECLRASELFLSSSVRGILPVQALGNTVYAPGPVTRAMQRYWRDLGFPAEQA